MAQKQVERVPRTPAEDGEPSTPAGMVTDRFGMAGLAALIRSSRLDSNPFSLGLRSDVSTLGLNLTSPGPLYPTFRGPWAESPCRLGDIDHRVPAEYTIDESVRERLGGIRMDRYGEDVLFFVFYTFPGDLLQVQSAAELHKREWCFHKDERAWIKLASASPTEQTSTYERGTYAFFDPVNWQIIEREFKLVYDRLGEPPSIPRDLPGDR
ncbi:CCR4-NOT transcription complex subunit 2-like [Haemaphysalis longicornis]